ncbi:MFS transporter, partial [Streptomyces massasporeus]
MTTAEPTRADRADSAPDSDHADGRRNARGDAGGGARAGSRNGAGGDAGGGARPDVPADARSGAGSHVESDAESDAESGASRDSLPRIVLPAQRPAPASTAPAPAPRRKRRYTVLAATGLAAVTHILWFFFFANSGGDLAAQDAWAEFV